MSDAIRVQPDRANQSMMTLPRVGGLAALLTDAILLIGLVGLAIQHQGLGLKNWLIVLFQINAGSLPFDTLRIFNPLDVAVLGLVGLTFLGLWPTVGRLHRIWTGIAIAMPFTGIALLLVTGLWGRSAVMGAGLMIGVLMLVSLRSGRLLSLTCLLANGLLLMGDLGTGILPGALLAPVIASGYILFVGVYALLADSLFRARTPLGLRSTH